MFCKLNVAIVLLAAGFLPEIWADSVYTVEQIFFLPPTFYVGDLVEMRIRISVESGVVPTEPSELPAPSWIHIRDVRIIPISEDYDIRVSFSSYETGGRMLPPIVMGDLVLADIAIETESIITDEAVKIEEAFGPALLPGSRLLLAVLIGAFLVLPIAASVFFAWSRNLIVNVVRLRNEHRPFRILNQTLDELKQQPSPVNNKQFYSGLSDGFKRYLAVRLIWDSHSLTASELQAVLLEAYADIPVVARAAAELPRFDLVKFGGRKVSPARRKRDVATIRDAAAGLETHIATERNDRKKQRRNRVDA